MYPIIVLSLTGSSTRTSLMARTIASFISSLIIGEIYFWNFASASSNDIPPAADCKLNGTLSCPPFKCHAVEPQYVKSSPKTEKMASHSEPLVTLNSDH